jgi:hypothetical protein
MPTALEMMRREALQRAVYARFTKSGDERVRCIVTDKAWLLARHAVDAVLDAERTLGSTLATGNGEAAR